SDPPTEGGGLRGAGGVRRADAGRRDRVHAPADAADVIERGSSSMPESTNESLSTTVSIEKPMCVVRPMTPQQLAWMPVPRGLPCNGGWGPMPDHYTWQRPAATLAVP